VKKKDPDRPKIAAVLPTYRDLHYCGAGCRPPGGYVDTINPATSASLGLCAGANEADVEAAVQVAHHALRQLPGTKPLERTPP